METCNILIQGFRGDFSMSSEKNVGNTNIIRRLNVLVIVENSTKLRVRNFIIVSIVRIIIEECKVVSIVNSSKSLVRKRTET